MGSMRKEMTVGFSVIAVLLLVLGLLIYRRATAMWKTPDANALAAASSTNPVVPIDGRPRVVVAQDEPPADQQYEDGRDPAVESNAADQTYAAPMARHEPPHSSFLPRQVDPTEDDPANPAAYDDGQPAGDDGPMNAESSGVMPADSDSSMISPRGGRQTSLEVSDGDFAGPGTAGSPDADNSLPDDASGMADPRRELDCQEWAASADPNAVEGVPASGSLAAEPASDQGYDRPGMAEQPAGGPAAGFAEFERREDDRHFNHAHQEPERVAIENGKYTVAPNDSYWIISEKIYGNGAYYKALHEHNRARHPRSDKLQVGDVLDAPSVASLTDRYPDLCPKPRKVPNARQTLQPASTRHHAGERVYVVGEGDTLFDIARHELGKAARWSEIYDLNRDVLGEDFDYLRPGTELALPRDRRDSDSVTRKDEPVYQR